MAGDWIKFEVATPDKPEVIGIARILGIDQDAVVGKLVRIWIWADQQLRDGNGARVTKSFVDRVTFCAGFAQAMVEVGWLRDIEDGIEFSNFDRHNGQTAKTRALTKNRVASRRTKMLRTQRNDSVTESLPEKRREESIKKDSPNGESSPDLFQSDGPSAVLTFPTTGKVKTWNLTPAKLAEYQETFPDLDALGECRRALQWCRDNQANRKTPRGMPAFLSRWLTKAVDRGGGARAGPQRTSRVPTDEDLNNWNPVTGNE